MKAGMLALPLAAVALNELAEAVLDSLPRCGFRRADRLTSSATTQAQIQGYKLVHPQIAPINELLQLVKRLHNTVQQRDI